MAGPLLKRQHTLVWLPPRADARPPADARLLALRPGDTRLSVASMDGLADTRGIVLVLDARDVSLLPVTLPPLSGARLARALPNAVEDLLLQDAASCLLALGPSLADGRRLVAACDRAWLQGQIEAFTRRGLSVQAVWPGMLALPFTGTPVLACVNDGLALRQGEFQGLGWTAGHDAPARRQAVAALLGMTAPEGELSVLLQDEDWREPVTQALTDAGRTARIQLLGALAASPVDLLPPLRGRLRAKAFTRIDWPAWRWPLGLAAAAALVTVLGLNLHWGQLAAREAALQEGIERAFTQAMPAGTVLVDPVLQLSRRAAELRGAAGTASSDDFVPMVQRLAQALGPVAQDALASAEWRDGTLRVRLREAAADAGRRDEITRNLAAAGLTIEFDAGGQATALVRNRR